MVAWRVTQIIFATLAIAAAVLSMFSGIMWLKLRKIRAEVVQRIRDRRVDPSFPEQEA